MVEATQKNPADSEREALISEMLRDAKKVEIPSELTKNPVIDSGKETGAPTILKGITSAGYVYVWNSKTGEKVPVLYYRLGQILRDREKDGSYRFTTVDPKVKPVKGAVKCMLHPMAEHRQHYTELGFRTCPKENLLNQYQLRRHMQLKHPQEWAAIEEERKEKERQEDRQLQQFLLARAFKEGEEKTPEVKETPVPEPKLEGAILKVEAPSKKIFLCRKCGDSFGAEKTRDKHELTCDGILKT